MFLQRNQGPTEPIDSYVTELGNCEFGEIYDGLMTSRIVEGIRSDKVLDRKGSPWKRTQASTMKPCQKTKQEFGDKRKSASHQTGNPSNCRNCGRQHPPKQCRAFGRV